MPSLTPALTQETCVAALENFQVDLRDPVFSQGVVSTDRGGIISTKDIRIQAQKIAYTHRIENGLRVQKIEAEGDLLFQYGDQAFTGKRLEYDYASRTGIIWEGKTFVDIWFLGGEKIFIQADGSYYFENAYITTSESQDHLWDIHAGRIKISKHRLLSARNIRLNFIRIPLLWLPSLKSNLRFMKNSPIRYKVIWDKALHPRLSARYRIYSWEAWQLFLRGDYRIGKGGALALETEYENEEKTSIFNTRSYGAIDDKSTPIQKGNNHYRFMGLYRSQSRDGSTRAHLSYDKISDEKMVSDLPSEDFEIDTNGRTHFWFEHWAEDAFVHFHFQPRINYWQSLNQELPALHIGIRPYSIGKSGIITNNYATASFLHYTYATNLQQYIGNMRAARIETVNELYRPLRLGHISLTPRAGIIGLYYSNSPSHTSIGQFLWQYGADSETRYIRTYSHHTHLLQPYLSYRGWTKPKSSIGQHYIFSIRDGWSQMNSLRIGVRNCVYSGSYLQQSPTLVADCYTYGFFGPRGDLTHFPRCYFDIEMRYPSCVSLLSYIWNIQQHVVDRINARIRWTISDYVALAVEMRHRSKYEWRKADKENFFLDVTQPISQLTHSPISDGRNTLLGEFEFHPHPLWTCHVTGHIGWGRGDQRAYHSEKIDLYTLIATAWRLRVSTSFMPHDIRFDFGIHLIK